MEQRPRLVRAVEMLRRSRRCLAEALEELERRHPDDPALTARITRWRLDGGVPFRG